MVLDNVELLVHYYRHQQDALLTRAVNIQRAKDKAHRKEVNNKILADLIKVGASEDVAKNIITAIVKGEVFATKITY